MKVLPINPTTKIKENHHSANLNISNVMKYLYANENMPSIVSIQSNEN